MKHRAVLAGLLLAWQTVVHAAGWDGGFEQLRYDIRWLFIPAGVAIIQAAPIDPDTAEFRLEACSHAALDLIYKVRDQVIASALIEPGGFASQQYRYQQEEGTHRADLSVDFATPGTVHYVDHLEGENLDFPTATRPLDIATAFFQARGLALEVGTTYEIPVFDKKKQYQLAIEVLRRETIRTPLGKQTRTLVIHPRLQTDGFFKRKGEILIWLTDDERHIPVRMTSRVRIGKVVTELTDIVTTPAASQANGMICEALRKK